MDAETQIQQLSPIIRSAAAPVVHTFNAAAMSAKSSSSGGSRTVITQQLIATDYAHKLVAAVWQELKPALDMTHIPWNDATLTQVGEVVEAEVHAAADALYLHVRQKKAAYLAPVEAAEREIGAALSLHVDAVRAQLNLYVFDRRRREVLQLLEEIDRRLRPEASEGMLEQLRQAKSEAESSSTDGGKLKASLEILSSTIQALPAAYDLGRKLVKVLASW